MKDFKTPLVHAVSRIQKGYHAKDLWSADIHICSVTGNMLIELADIAHGYPENYGVQDGQNPDDVDSYSLWTQDLRTYGTYLVHYSHKFTWEIDATLEEEAQAVTNAQTALKWVSENLMSLWD